MMTFGSISKSSLVRQYFSTLSSSTPTLYDFSKLSINWFPQHMHVGLQKMRHLIERCDVVLEVRDARIPHSSVSSQLLSLLRQAKSSLQRYIVYNKVDLADSASLQKFLTLEKNQRKIYVTSAYDKNSYRLFFKDIINEILTKYVPGNTRRIRLLVVGVPNVGKSTLINRFRAFGTGIGGRAVPVGNLPGVTRAVSNLVRISNQAPIYIYDSPGILMPRIRDSQTALKLAITGAIPMTVINEYILVDYILFTLRKHLGEDGCQVTLHKELGLKESVSDPVQFMEVVASNKGWNQINAHNATLELVQAFRSGKLGKFTLDDTLWSHEDAKDTPICVE